MLHDSRKPLCAAMLMLLVLSVTGCAHNSPKLPEESLQLPPAPALSTPLPSVSYSITAAETIKSWREKQMGTRLMREPVPQPGR